MVTNKPLSKNTTFLVTFLLVAALLSLLTVSAVNAQSPLPKPSVPQFTVKLVDHSYDAPTTYSIDPYTGANVTTPSHHVDNKTIELTIQNQPLAHEANGFCYDVRVRGSYSTQDWIPMHSLGDGPFPSNSDYTTIIYQLVPSTTEGNQTYTLESYDTNFSTNTITGLPLNAQLDFQVEAAIGCWAHSGMEFGHFEGEESGWSATQTVAIGTSASPTSSPTQQPGASTQDGLVFGVDWQTTAITILAIAVAALAVSLFVVLRHKTQNSAV